MPKAKRITFCRESADTFRGMSRESRKLEARVDAFLTELGPDRFMHLSESRADQWAGWHHITILYWESTSEESEKAGGQNG